jgi:hypothetical protein
MFEPSLIDCAVESNEPESVRPATFNGMLSERFPNAQFMISGFPRVLQYSNPYVDFQGWPRVVSGSCEAYNTLTAQSLSRDTAELFAPLNPLVDWIFDSSFDELENNAPPICIKP